MRLTGYAWVAAFVALATAGLVLFAPIRVVQAQGTGGGSGATPTGTTPAHPCLRGEGASAPKDGGSGSCYYCKPPPSSTDHGGTDDEEDQKGGAGTTTGGGSTTTPKRLPGYSYSEGGGATPTPGNGGALDPHSGAFTCSVNLPAGRNGGPLCGGCYGLGPYYLLRALLSALSSLFGGDDGPTPEPDPDPG